MAVMGNLLGYTTDQWIQFYKLYVFVEGKAPKSLFDLISFWEKQPKNDPKSCFKIAAEYSQALVTVPNGDAVLEMIENFLYKTQGRINDKSERLKDAGL